MRALVTGARGFVGRWLRAHLEASGDEVADCEPLDVTDPAAVEAAVRAARPDAVYHLAALTHVRDSWGRPAEFLRVNAMGTLHVLEAVRAAAPGATVLLTSSAEVYGWVKPEQLPLVEDAPLRPVTPYAASKVAAEFLALQAHLGHHLRVLWARAFNHVGPGQAAGFLLPSLARRIVEAERTGAASIRVGNLGTRRDITDVRDVVRAYRLLVERGEPGAAYNVCSGRDFEVGGLLARLIEASGGDFGVEVDPDLVRPVDIPVLRGDPSRIHATVGWTAEIPLEVSLLDVLEDARAGT